MDLDDVLDLDLDEDLVDEPDLVVFFFLVLPLVINLPVPSPKAIPLIVPSAKALPLAKARPLDLPLTILPYSNSCLVCFALKIMSLGRTSTNSAPLSPTVKYSPFLTMSSSPNSPTNALPDEPTRQSPLLPLAKAEPLAYAEPFT